MKANELNELKVEELQAKASELQQELFNLRFQLHTGHLENTALGDGVEEVEDQRHLAVGEDTAHETLGVPFVEPGPLVGGG